MDRLPCFLAQFPAGQRTVFQKYPWLDDLLVYLLAAALIIFMFYWVRGARRPTGFTIHVADDDISFTGDFPAELQATVVEFLRTEVPATGSYQIRGHWERGLHPDGAPALIVAVSPESARAHESRIGNFLRLNLTSPRRPRF